MSRQARISVNLDGLKKLAADARDTYARVGVLAGNNMREGDSAVSNYDLALIHEFGDLEGNIPARSFLRFPIEFKRKDIMVFIQKRADIMLKEGNALRFFSALGAYGQTMVQQAFDTRGFGQWAPNKPSTIAAKGGKDSPLIDTAALRKSVTYDVKTK